MPFELLRERGVPIDAQVLTWSELVPAPLERPDPRTTMRVVLARAVSGLAVAFAQSAVDQDRALGLPLARVQRSEQHERTLVTSLWPPAITALEGAAAVARTCVELDAARALREDDPYVAQALRFAMLEHVDQLYRLDALGHRLLGRGLDPRGLGETEVQPGRPAWRAHRDPADDLRTPCERHVTLPMTRVALVLAEALCTLARDGLTSAVAAVDDPGSRRLFAELASLEDQHVAQFVSLHERGAPLIERWLVLESAEAFAYHGAAHHEPTSGLADVWERLLAHELGQLHLVASLYEAEHHREPEGVIPLAIAEPLPFEGHAEYVREVVRDEAELTATGTSYADRSAELPSWPSVVYRQRLGAAGWPSQAVGEGATRPLDLAAE